ncbi:MAG: hypothetical protein ACLR2M_02470 [Varibaculum sp.]
MDDLYDAKYGDGTITSSPGATTVLMARNRPMVAPSGLDFGFRIVVKPLRGVIVRRGLAKFEMPRILLYRVLPSRAASAAASTT